MFARIKDAVNKVNHFGVSSLDALAIEGTEKYAHANDIPMAITYATDILSFVGGDLAWIMMNAGSRIRPDPTADRFETSADCWFAKMFPEVRESMRKCHQTIKMSRDAADIAWCSIVFLSNLALFLRYHIVNYSGGNRQAVFDQTSSLTSQRLRKMHNEIIKRFSKITDEKTKISTEIAVHRWFPVEMTISGSHDERMASLKTRLQECSTEEMYRLATFDRCLGLKEVSVY